MHESALGYHAVETGKGRPEAVVEASACVCDNVKESRLILKNAGKRLLVRASKLLGGKKGIPQTLLGNSPIRRRFTSTYRIPYEIGSRLAP
jgi:hypothetical protein